MREKSLFLRAPKGKPYIDLERMPSHKIVLPIFLLSLLARLLFLLLEPGGLGNVGWYLDSYHHWQIAYFTLKIGIFRGPRLWDLGGLEYFWGILPPLTQALLLGILKTTSILPYRIANSVFGSSSIVLVYLITKKYFGQGTGIATAVIGAVNPVLIAADTSGMNEPLGIMFLLLALYCYAVSEFRTGVFLALASMCRAEYWILSIGVLALYVVCEKSVTRLIPGLAGWMLLMIPYMWHLDVNTGNPVYPVYWNFFGNIAGQWVGAVQLTEQLVLLKGLFLSAFILSVISLGFLIWKRPKSYPVFALFLGYFLLQAATFGFSAYIAQWAEWFPYDRIFSLTYIFAILAFSVLAFRSLKRRFPKFARTHVRIGVLLAVLLVQSLAWFPISNIFNQRAGVYKSTGEFAGYVVSQYHGGTVLVPGAEVYLTYSLVQNGITAEHMLSEKYHPESYEDTVRWLHDSNVTLALFHKNDEFYQALASRYPLDFTLIDDRWIQVYRVTL